MTRKILPFLFEKADKLLLLAVPYLAFISVLYYAGYWGILGIDVYNYFAVSDLVKGAAYPMQLALAAATLVAIADWLLSYVSFLAIRQKKKPLIIFFVGIAFIALTCLVTWQSASITWDLLKKGQITGIAATTLPLVNVPAYVVVLVLLFGWWATSKILPAPLLSHKDLKALSSFRLEPLQLKNPRSILRLLVFLNKIPERFLTAHFQQYALVLSLLSTPLLSFASGYYQAQSVLTGKQFDYVERQVYQGDKLLMPYPILKYLGRVGEYHFLLTPDNQNRIIIGKDRWPTLLLRSSKGSRSSRI